MRNTCEMFLVLRRSSVEQLGTTRCYFDSASVTLAEALCFLFHVVES